MKSPYLVPILCFFFVASAATQDRPAPDATGNVDPHASDQFSGRTIEAGQMASDLVYSRIKHSPRVGEKAPKLELYSLDRESEVTLEELHHEKPVVLIFASWTCRVFKESALGLALVAPQYKEDVDFVFVYIREAHPGNPGEHDDITDPASTRARIDAALAFKAQTRLPFPILVDPINDKAATRWAAWPVRLYCIDTDGTVIYSGAQGPWGYRPYEGFLHGNGQWFEMDIGFNKNSLEDFLQSRFGEAEDTGQ